MDPRERCSFLVEGHPGQIASDHCCEVSRSSGSDAVLLQPPLHQKVRRCLGEAVVSVAETCWVFGGIEPVAVDQHHQNEAGR